MPQLTVISLTPGTESEPRYFEGYLLVRSAEQRVSAKKGNVYLDIVLGDKTGEISCKKWDSTPAPKSGTVVFVRGQIQEYQGRVQMRIEQMRDASNDPSVSLANLIPCAPEKAEDMLAEIQATIDEMKTLDLQKILREMIAMCGDRLLYFPSAQRLHHAEKAGLLHHTVSILRAAKSLLPLYPFLNADLVLAGAIAHDLSKTTEFLCDESGNVSDYSPEGQLLGHLVQGVSQVQEAARRSGVQGEWVLLLSHMVISHHGCPEYGSPKPPMFAEAEMLHELDDLDAKMDEMNSILNRIPEGAFSERIVSLCLGHFFPCLLL